MHSEIALRGDFDRLNKGEQVMRSARNFSRRMATGILTVLLIAVSGLLLAAQQKSVTVEGYVLDSACAFTKNLDKPISRECALSCAKTGSQLVILTSDGTIYWPIDAKTPAAGQNDRLLEFAGGRVKATGKLYDRGGSHALVIETIQASAPAK
jgi:hypothetical protein